MVSKRRGGAWAPWVFLAILVVGGGQVDASDPVAVYALVESVTFEPNEKAPEKIRIAGAFAVASGNHGEYYAPPRWGVLYFSLPAEAADNARKEWADLKSVAGKGECVGFGMRYEGVTPEIWREDDTNAKPVPYYREDLGVQRVRNVGMLPVVQLMTLPKPLAPAAGNELRAEASGHGRWAGQEVTLVARNARENKEGTRYLFEVETASGGIIASPPVAPGPDHTSWKVNLHLNPGDVLRWRVRVVRDDLAAVAVAALEVRVLAAGS